MTVKEWLSRARNMDKEINELIEAQDRAYRAAIGATALSDGERVQTSSENTTEKKFLNYASYSECIDKRIDELYEVKQEILAAINGVSDNTLRTLLIARYINCKTWEQIADDMNYSSMQVKRLHEKALKRIKI